MTVEERVTKELIDGAELFTDPVVVLIDLAEVTGVYMLMLGWNAIMCEREDATVLKLRGEAVKRVLDIPDMIDYVNSFAELESDPGPYDDVDYSKVVASFNQDPWLLIYTILGAWA